MVGEKLNYFKSEGRFANSMKENKSLLKNIFKSHGILKKIKSKKEREKQRQLIEGNSCAQANTGSPNLQQVSPPEPSHTFTVKTSNLPTDSCQRGGACRTG